VVQDRKLGRWQPGNCHLPKVEKIGNNTTASYNRFAPHPKNIKLLAVLVWCKINYISMRHKIEKSM